MYPIVACIQRCPNCDFENATPNTELYWRSSHLLSVCDIASMSVSPTAPKNTANLVDSQIELHVDLPVQKIDTNLLKRLEYVFLCPSLDLDKKAKGKCLEPVEELDKIDHTELLEPTVFRPRPEREAKLARCHILEAGIAHPLVKFRARGRLEAQLASNVHQPIVPFCEIAVHLQGPVSRVYVEVVVLELGPASRY